MKKLLVVMALALLVFGLLPGCQSQQGSGPESPSVAVNNTANPALTEGAATTSSQVNSMNSWNLDYATVKYDSSGHQSWVARYNGPGNANDEAHAIAVDKSGNTYVTGGSMGSGNGTHYDYATIKYDKSGKQLWVARYSSSGYVDSTPHAIAVDNAGNVYVTGESSDTESDSDYTTIKYDGNGHEQWVARYNGPGDVDYPYALVVDGSGNVYVTGVSRGNNDTDDCATIKYDSTGRQIWVARYVNGSPFALALDRVGNVYVTGFSRINGSDYLTVKYDNDGNQLWAATYNGPGNSSDIAYGLAVDSVGNVYVTGRSPASTNGANEDYATVKYDSSGKELWVARYDGPGNSDDEAYSSAVDAAGDVYVTGESLRSDGNRDFATVKYNSNGVQQWVARYTALENGDNIAWALAVDASGNAYVTGQSGVAGSSWGYATVKYDRNGNQFWAALYPGPGKGFDEAHAIAVDGDGNVYITGQSAGNNGITQMPQPPWPDVSVYNDTAQTIEVKVGEEFAFGFDTFAPGGLGWYEKHDDKMLSLLDKEGILLKPEYPSNENIWFLFKALKAGKTQITFTYSHGEGSPMNDQKVFNIDIQ